MENGLGPTQLSEMSPSWSEKKQASTTADFLGGTVMDDKKNVLVGTRDVQQLKATLSLPLLFIFILFFLLWG